MEELPDGWAVKLPTSDDTLQLVARFIDNDLTYAKSRRCCPFFDFNLNVSHDAGPIWLRLTGRAGVKDFLTGAFAYGATAPRGSHD